MTCRQRKRGGAHFALTCDAPSCPADTDKSGLTGGPVLALESSYTVRARARGAGWTTAARRTEPWLPPVITDFCPDHNPEAVQGGTPS